MNNKYYECLGTEHYIKSIAKSMYSLLRGREFSLQMSLLGDIPEQRATVNLSYVTLHVCKARKIGVTPI
jgi:hypothetical protein